MLNKHDLEEFIGLVSQAEKKKSPEIRLPVAAARRVADGLSFLLLDLDETRRTLATAQQDLQDSAVTSVEIDGGSFK